MKIASWATGALFCVAAASPVLAEPMAMDIPVNMGPLEFVCTGVGSAKDNPIWSSYPIRIEFSNGAAQYLAGAHVVLSQGSTTYADFECAGPWVLVKGPAGSYKVTTTMMWGDQKGMSKSTTFSMAHSGQKRVVIQYGPTMPRSNSAETAPGTIMPSGQPVQ